MKISYENKIGLEPYTIRKNQCQDLDMNEIKSVVNDNDTCEAETSYPIRLDKTSAGRRYGSWGMPMQGVISVTQSGIQEGGCAVIVWEGNTTPAVTGVVIQQYVGVITEQGVYSIYIHFINGRANVNIFGQSGDAPVPEIPDAPTNLAVGTVTDNTIPLTWTKSATGVMVEYRVYINYNLQQTFSGDVASGTLTGLASGTAYNLISVRAFDGTYESTDSNFVNATTTGGGATPSATAPTITVTESPIIQPSATAPTITVTESVNPNLIGNGEFSTDMSLWNDAGTSTSSSISGEAFVTGGTSPGIWQNPSGLEVGETYRVTGIGRVGTGTDVRIRAAEDSTLTPTIQESNLVTNSSSNEAMTLDFVCTSVDNAVYLRVSANGNTGYFDNIECRKIS